MKNSSFNEEQIIGILKQSEVGAKRSELCRQHGISAATFYAWRSKYGGLEVSEARRLRQREEENSKLKRMVAEISSDLHNPRRPLHVHLSSVGEHSDILRKTNITYPCEPVNDVPMASIRHQNYDDSAREVLLSTWRLIQRITASLIDDLL